MDVEVDNASHHYEPTPSSLDICTDLARKTVGFHVKLFPQPPSLGSIGPSDCTMLCSLAPDSTFVIHEDRVVDGLDVVQLVYTVIHDECMWEYEEEPTVKDDFLPLVPPPLYLDILCDSFTFDFPYENSSLDVSTSDHSHDTAGFSLLLHCREDTNFSENTCNLSSIIFRNTEGEHSCFS